MKSLQFIERPAKKQLKYKFADIGNAIFYNTQPVVIIQPFSLLKDPELSKLVLKLSINVHEKGAKLLRVLSTALEGDVDKNLKDISALPDWVIVLIYTRYKEEFDRWINYIFDNMSKFCEEDSESVINWSLVEHGGISSLFPTKLTFEQKIWISVCSKKHQGEWIDFIVNLKDSLLPWLNMPLYKKVQDNLDNSRFNTSYEKQRQKFLEGKPEDLDTIE